MWLQANLKLHMCLMLYFYWTVFFCTNDNRIWGPSKSHKCSTSCSKRTKKKVLLKVLKLLFFHGFSLNLLWISLVAI